MKHANTLLLFSLYEESRAAARKPRDAEAIPFGLMFANQTNLTIFSSSTGLWKVVKANHNKTAVRDWSATQPITASRFAQTSHICCQISDPWNGITCSG